MQGFFDIEVRAGAFANKNNRLWTPTSDPGPCATAGTPPAGRFSRKTKPFRGSWDVLGTDARPFRIELRPMGEGDAEIGRASCRERGWIRGGAGSVTKSQQ